jgi:hypothetical protein
VFQDLQRNGKDVHYDVGRRVLLFATTSDG